MYIEIHEWCMKITDPQLIFTNIYIYISGIRNKMKNNIKIEEVLRIYQKS